MQLHTGGAESDANWGSISCPRMRQQAAHRD